MAKLYEIDQAILECLDLETGEIIDEERLEALQMERDKKIEWVALEYKNTLSDAAAYKQEKDSFAEKEKHAKNRAESLKGWLSFALNGQKFQSPRVNISYRKSASVSVLDEAKIPEEYLKYAEPTVDKAAIKEAMKSGQTVPGAELEEKQNIQIR